MANPEHLAKLREGVAEWNRWKKANPAVLPALRCLELRGADLRGAYLSGADLSHASLTGANLSGADLSGADLSATDLVGADPMYVHPFPIGCEELCADLSGANLSGANLSRTRLRHANLSGTNFGGASLYFADLSHANLSHASLRGADLSGADLSGADLSMANLVRANFNNAGMSASNLERALVDSTVFGACDLSEVVGLDVIQHRGPSMIDINTIFRSHGKIPEVFLRGAGVPDNFITYMHSLVGRAFEFYSCFISYSTKDQDFAERLYADLQAKGVRCWFAPHDMESGKKLHEQIDQAIRLHERLLLILSPDSIKSEWVKTEIKKARNREIKGQKRVLFPIRLISFEELKEWEYIDPDTGKDIALEIREYYIPDFSKWKEDHELYQKDSEITQAGMRGASPLRSLQIEERHELTRGYCLRSSELNPSSPGRR